MYKAGKYATGIKYDVKTYHNYEIIFIKKISKNKYQRFYLKNIDENLVLDYIYYCDKKEKKKILKTIYKVLIKAYFPESGKTNISFENIKEDNFNFYWFFSGNDIIKKVLKKLDKKIKT